MAEPTEPFQLPDQNITVVGLFNPDILTPPWVVKFIQPAEDPTESQFMLAPGGLPARINRSGDLYWESTRNRLRALGPPEKTSAFVSKVLKTLPHAPLTAAGVNFIKSVSMAEQPPQFFDLPGAPVARGAFQTVLLDGQVKLTVKVTFQDDERAILDFNFHLDAIGDDNVARANQLASHAERAPEFAVVADGIAKGLANG